MLSGLMARNAAAWPSKTAIVHGERRVSHAELNRETGQLARRLRELGAGEGDTVVIALPNCPEFTIAFFAAMRVHAIAMPLNPDCTPAELDRFLSDKPVRAMITNGPRALGRFTDTVQIVIPDGGARFDPMPSRGDDFAGDALYLYTSGSTGSAKRVVFTQKQLYWEARNFVESTGIGQDDPIACPVPLYHSYGLCLGMLVLNCVN